MSQQHLYAVILAGGSGTRFWPVSRKKKPKQFLEIAGGKSLLDLTISRLKLLVKPAHIYIVTNEKHNRETKKHIKKFRIPDKNILLEPVGKNTAPAVYWAACRIHHKDPKAVIAVLPSDHLILNQLKFVQIVKKAAALASLDYLVTFGIVPTRSETGYGYLKTKLKKERGRKILLVEKFTEKPSAARAKNFLKSKKYFWNSGMFVWKTETILEEFRKHLPKLESLLTDNPMYPEILKSWKKCPNISIDYGILEKSKRVAAVSAKDLGWSDMGSWESLIETLSRDKSGNVHLAKVLNINSKNTLVYGKDKLIATIGLKNCIIVDTPDALLVCHKDQSQHVKELVVQLQKKKSSLL